MTAAGMLRAARKDLGLAGRPNRITRDYAGRNGQEYLRAAWCQMGVTWWARRSGNEKAVLPNGDRAYTVWHAEDGERLGRWYAGTAANIRKYARPGAILFMDWGGSDRIGAIDHVGIVERNLGDGRVQTIEGNTGDACKRRVRGPGVIAGFWNPAYKKQQQEEDDMPSAKEIADAVYARFTHEVAEGVWAEREGILAKGQKIDPRSAFRQIWAYGKDGYSQLREILARLEAQNATISTLAKALAEQNSAVDADELVARIRQEIAGIKVRLAVDDEPAAGAS